jgi:acyl-homoserine lactone acylase PvdQ
VGEEFIIGACIPGTIYFSSARNEHMTWGVTSNNLDKADIFEEQINHKGD